MQFHKCLIFIFLCYVCVNVIADDKNEKNKSVFVPTREWQVVNKGTPIPKGLHIRYNFKTGQTEAKLLDTDDVSEKTTSENAGDKQVMTLVVHPDSKSSEKLTKPSRLEIPIEELKLKLKKIKSDEAEISQDKVEDIKKKFKSYQDLKKEFDSLNMNISTEIELMKDFFARFMANKDALILETPNKFNVKKILDILDDLEYLIHQIDNAQVFTDMGGMTEIISPCLNSTSDEIKSEALRLLGATAQSNPKVQAKALESDFIQKLLHMLITNDNVKVKSRCLFALSSLLRQFPAAQKVFIDHGGLEVFAKILEGNQLQSQTRVMNLVNDLLIERRNIDEFSNEEQRRQRTKAYEITNFEQKLLMHEYCRCLTYLTRIVFRNVITGDFIEQADEVVQLLVESMITLNPVCETEFMNHRKTLLPLIESVLTTYQKLSLEPKTDEDEADGNHILTLEKLKVLLGYSHDEL